MIEVKVFGFFAEQNKRSELVVSTDKEKVKEECKKLLDSGVLVTAVHEVTERSKKQHQKFIREI